MKRLERNTIFSIVLFYFLFSAAIPISWARDNSPQDSKALEVAVKNDVLKEIASWDSQIVFLTAKNNPIKTLEEITDPAKEVAMWGLELFSKVGNLLTIAGVKNQSLRIIGDAYFPKLFLENQQLRLFVSWRKIVQPIIDSGGGVEIKFIESKKRPLRPKTAEARSGIPGME